MNSWPLQLFARLTSEGFGPPAGTTSGIGGFTSVSGSQPVPGRLTGDFVECGVNRGFLSSAIMDYLDWDNLGKHFYLLDTCKGIDERFLSVEDVAAGALQKNRANLANGFYASEIESVRENFAEWKNLSLIEGAIPETCRRFERRKTFPILGPP